MTRRYRVVISATAALQIRKLDANVRGRLVARLDALARDPRPPGSVELKGAVGLRRIRVGDWRVVYQIHDAHLEVLVVRVGHRREVYRGV